MAGKESAQVQVPVTNYLVPIRATGITGGTAQVPPCRAASRAASQVRGALRPGNTDHFRGRSPSPGQGVALASPRRPRKRPRSNAALQHVLTAQLIDSAGKTGNCAQMPLELRVHHCDAASGAW
jgi:hypothetical protein